MDTTQGMKILHIIDSGGGYGAEGMLLNLVAEQVVMGFGPIIASIGDPQIDEKPLETEALRRGLRVEKFRMRPGPNLFGALEILRFARHEGVDILHSHGYKGDILFGLMPKNLRKIPMLTTLHGWTWTGGFNRMGLYEWLDRLSLRFVDEVVLVSSSMRLKLSLSRVHVVNNGIPPAGESIEQHTTLDPSIVDFCQGGYTIGALGRLSPEKGFDILLDALHEVSKANPEARLVILGEGGERVDLEAKIKRLGLERRVLLPGYVADAKRYLPFFHIYVLSSLTEGLPMVILEAMQAGVPIVSTKVGAVPEVLENGNAGILVSPDDPTVLTEGIMKLVNDASLRAQLVANGKKIVLNKYSSRVMAMKYSEIYGQLHYAALP